MLFRKLMKSEMTKYKAARAEYETLIKTVKETGRQLDDAYRKGMEVAEEVYDVMNTIANTPKEIETEIGKVFVRIHGVRGCNPFWKGSLDTYLNHNTSITSAAFAQIAFVEKDFGFSITIILASLGIKLIKIPITNLQKAKNAKANTRIILKTNAGLRIALKKADARIHEVYAMISNLSDKNEKLLSFRNADYRNLSDDDKKWLWNMHINTTALLEIIKDNVLL